MDDTEKYVRLLTMVLCDTVPERPMPRYLVGETADNQRSVFERMGYCNAEYPIAISGGETTGYPGATAWVQEITRRYGIPPRRVHVIPGPQRLNTLTEMRALAWFAHELEWEELTLVAAPFHQLRAFLTLLGAQLRLDVPWPKRVYNLPGVALPWQDEALHSQGVVRTTREGLIGTEWDRILRYTAQGDLATVDQALEYLRRRDA